MKGVILHSQSPESSRGFSVQFVPDAGSNSLLYVNLAGGLEDSSLGKDHKRGLLVNPVSKALEVSVARLCRHCRKVE